MENKNTNKQPKQQNNKNAATKKQSFKPNSSNLQVFEKRSGGGSFGGNRGWSNQGGGFKKPNSGFKSNNFPTTTGYEEKIVNVKRISKTTKGGRSMRFSALAIIGDKKGLLGFGMGKSIEVPVAIRKALKEAKNNMYRIKMNKKNTLFHEVTGKHGAGKVLIKPAPEGTGIIAGGPIKVILELCGFRDVYSKNLGKNTPLNMVRATINGLLMQKTPKEIASLRDKELKEL